MNRNNGLTTLRAIAILLVFLHNFYYANHNITFGIITQVGWIGVDLFFVLSGVLIGNQIFSSIQTNSKFLISTFIFRRILRTVPNYLIVVLFYWIFLEFRDAVTLPDLWKVLTFTTNLVLITGTALSYTWSLCIEEQFYLILPIIFILFIQLKSLKLTWILIALFIIIGIILRGYIWFHYIHGTEYTNNLNFRQFSIYQTMIYFFTPCRLDELIIGVSIAILKNFHSSIWQKLTSNGNLSFTIGILCTIPTVLLIYYKHYTLIATIISYPILGISFGLLVISALSPNSFLYKTNIPLTPTIAKLSFAIYLVEKPINHFIISIINNRHLFSSNIAIFSTATICVLISAWLLFICIETPFIRLRELLFKKPLYI